MNTEFQVKIALQKEKIENFISQMRKILSNNDDAVEKENRLEIFDTLLLLATYANSEELEKEFQSSLPLYETDNTINYMCRQLREINGFCKCSLSDEHEVYQDLFSTITFPSARAKNSARELLSQTISRTILEATNTAKIYQISPR
ncbi:hypothetical protein Lgra_2352 [Legionella gratiana]|uniref:Uncharacterized protein n=1 Tax=Legionella gratiana TaxID=45066 RepID=A0A378JDZ4_9GAMM|nr:hypothetical protein [Legionella gratiana]KTD09117.1 hypothetical protein Lgra_2352 [Legionella gratiana]STX45669.1 Uncharacterised protein [Legionella gratiana]